MRFVNTKTGRLVDASTVQTPKYATLSHRWAKKEVGLADIEAKDFRLHSSSKKLWGAVRQARHDGYKYLWVDTCCIDQQSSTELSEAINSMYSWYANAEVCYAYLQDVDKDNWHESFNKSEWFTRGWTLQELLASRRVAFYDREWRHLGNKSDLSNRIQITTGIPHMALDTGDLSPYSNAQKMAWAAKRRTTRAEDHAYCLMGVFDVNMPLLYGEGGQKAFLRLQEEIIKHNDDHSIFAWSMGKRSASGLLATGPECFGNSQEVVTTVVDDPREPFSMTNRGLSIKLEITPWFTDTYLAYLDCAREKKCDKEQSPSSTRMGIFLRRLQKDDQYIRISVHGRSLWYDNHKLSDQLRPTKNKRLFVRQRPSPYDVRNCLKSRVNGFDLEVDRSSTAVGIAAAHMSDDNRTAYLKFGEWGCVVTIDVSKEHKGLQRIALGFDFEFNPICLLEGILHEGSTIHQDNGIEGQDTWSRILADGVEWIAGLEPHRVFYKMIHDGLWGVKGNRIHGLDILLGQRLTDEGLFIGFHRDEKQSSLVWKFDIDILTGSHRNHRHRVLPDSGYSLLSNREFFQHVHGFGVDEKGFEEGDNLLRAMYPTIGDARQNKF